MVNEQYYRLQDGQSEKQFGVVIRVREGTLEELTGFLTFEKINTTKNADYYRANIMVDGNGNRLVGRGTEPDYLGISIPKKGFGVDITMQPRSKAHQVSIKEINMKEAGRIVDSVTNLRMTLQAL